MLLEKLLQVHLRLATNRLPEISAGDWCILVLSEVVDHLCHVSVSTDTHHELFEHLAERQDRDLKAGLSVACLEATRLLNKVEKLE